MERHIVVVVELTDEDNPELLMPVVEANGIEDAMEAAERHYCKEYPGSRFRILCAYTKEYLEYLTRLINGSEKPDIVASDYSSQTDDSEEVSL